MNTAQRNRTTKGVNNIEYEVSYRKIRYPRLEFKTGNLLLVLPTNYKDEAPLLKKYDRWINNKIRVINEALLESKNLVIIERSKEEFRSLVNKIIINYGELGKKANKIYFRKMTTKWASYSKSGNLTINTMAKYLPEELISYILFHELSHSIERKHNAFFWKLIEAKFPNHNSIEHQLFRYWFLLNIQREEY